MKMIKSTSFYILFLASFILSFLACKEKIEVVDSLSIPNYTSVRDGKFWVYKVDSLLYDRNGTDSLLSNYMKDIVTGTINDNLGRKLFRVFRYERKLPSQQWLPTISYTILANETNFEIVENNLKSSPISYPIKSINTWNGFKLYQPNAFELLNFTFSQEINKNLNTWTFGYKNIGKPYIVGTKNFDSTITVLQQDEKLIYPFVDIETGYRAFGEEVYAAGVGMVERKRFIQENEPKDVAGNTVIVRDPITNVIISIIQPTIKVKGIKRGFAVTMKLIENN